MSVLLFFAIFSSCAKTSITSFKDPQITNDKLKRILVIGTNLTLPSRQKLEERAVIKLSDNGITGISSIELFLPTRSYTESEVLAILEQNNIDALLILELSDAYSQQVYIPESYSSSSKGTVVGNQVNINTTTYKHGGYYLNKPRVFFNLKLISAKNGSTLWIGNSKTAGNAFADEDVLFDSLSESAVKQLHQDGII